MLRGTRAKPSEQDSQLNSQVQAQDQNQEQDLSKANPGDVEPVLGPAEAPGRLTLEELQAQYRGYRERWVSSETWKRLEGQLGARITERASMTVAKAEDGAGTAQNAGPVDAIVCVGLGSPSGFLRGGWVDRRSVSMYQLAALETIAQRVSRSLHHSLYTLSIPRHSQAKLTSYAVCTPSTPIQIYAQDPVFNDLDKSLLSSLHINVITHPTAFTLITPRTLLFCPGAERKHLEQLLPSNPCMVFGGPLEDTESDVIQGFAGRVGSVVLVPFEVCEYAFWKTRLYFRDESEGQEVRHGRVEVV